MSNDRESPQKVSAWKFNGCRWSTIAACAAMANLLWAPAARAIIVFHALGRNLDPPTGKWLNSGWQYEGDWHGFTGTAIGPHSFITAAHVRGYPGEAFVYRGMTYRALDATPLPRTDLCVWRVSGTFPGWAPLYTGTSEIAHDIFLYGRGTARGARIVLGGRLRGWAWGFNDNRLSWGRSWVQNIVVRSIGMKGEVRIDTAGGAKDLTGGGDCLLMPFDRDLGPDAACVSGGDSGGGAFLRDDDGIWKLAGVIYGVDEGCLTSKTAKKGFTAAMFDTRGLYRLTSTGMRVMVPAAGADLYPTMSIASRISSNAPAIDKAMLANGKFHHVLRYVIFAVGVMILFIFGLLRAAAIRSRKSSNLNIAGHGTSPEGTDL